MATTMDETKPTVIQYNIMMTDKILTNQRTYTQLIDVLGDIGGLMEVIESIFGVICIFVADILYDKTMVNNLFSFDLEEFVLKIKSKSKINNIIFEDKNQINEDNFDKKTIDISKKVQNKISIVDSINDNINTNKPMLNLRKKTIIDNPINLNNNTNERPTNSKRNLIKVQKSVVLPHSKTVKNKNVSNININDIKIYESEKETEKKVVQNRFIKKLDTNIFCAYFCFCFSRKR